MHGKRKIVMHFTNENVKWEKAYKLEKNKTSVRNSQAAAHSVAHRLPWAYRESVPARDPEKWKPVFGKDHAQN